MRVIFVRWLHGSGMREGGAEGELGSQRSRRGHQRGRGRAEAATASSGEVGAVVSGRTSTRGSASSMKWTAAELLDTAARRGVDGGRGYGEGVAAMASAMAWESEGEELER